MKPIAYIYTDFKTKFGLPRQSGLVKEITGKIVFEKEYSIAEAFKGLEDFSHIWILWEFSQVKKESWKPTVRPPLLGGNKRMGVFATRSPFRPNSIGLSCVKLERIDRESGFPRQSARLFNFFHRNVCALRSFNATHSTSSIQKVTCAKQLFCTCIT